MEKSTKPKPFLRWAGSKKKIVAELGSYWKNDNQYYMEPFVGSAQLYGYLNPARGCISDINSQLVTTYKAVQNQPLELHKCLDHFEKGKEAYYKVRSQNINSLSELQIAARLIYLNRYCFNGLYRTNLKGEFNVPYSGSRTGNLPTLEHLITFSKALKKIDIVQGDFEKVIKDNMKANSFIYMDPPFAIKNKRIFNQYDPSSFGTSDIERLIKLLDFIDEHKSSFVLSYAYDDELISLFKKWNIKTIDINRNIAGFANKRRKAQEIIITNI